MAEAKQKFSSETAGTAVSLADSDTHSTPAEIISDQLTALAKYHREMLEAGKVEPIHRMRVTTRKLQATLDFLVMKPDEIGIRGMKKELRDWRRQLSRVRNYDVFLEMIDQRTSAQRPVHFRQYQLIADELKKRREQIFVEVRQELDSIDLEGFAGRLGLSIDSEGRVHQAVPGEQGESGRDDLDSDGEPIIGPASAAQKYSRAAAELLTDAPRIAKRAKHRLHRRLDEFEKLAEKVKPTDDPAEIHQLRIAAKRLRYSMEAVSQLGYGNADRAMEWLKRLQDKLGDLHDIDSFEEEIADIIGRRDFIRSRMQDSGGMLHAASRLIGKRHTMAKKILPAKVPSFIAATTHRLVRRLSETAR